MTEISRVVPKEVVATHPLSAKKEFEELLRTICRIFSNAKAFGGSALDSVMQQTESSAASQQTWSRGWSVVQGVAPFAAIGLGWKKIDAGKGLEQGLSLFQVGAKTGEVLNACGGATQLTFDAGKQERQQVVAHYNAFVSGMDSVIHSLRAAQQRLQQKEMEEASNR